jgi:hypothetical protein
LNGYWASFPGVEVTMAWSCNLQFEGCRLGRKHNISISRFKVKYGWVILWLKAINYEYNIIVMVFSQVIIVTYMQLILQRKCHWINKFILTLPHFVRPNIDGLYWGFHSIQHWFHGFSRIWNNVLFSLWMT